MAISPERIPQIVQATVGQGQNRLCHDFSKNQLTASQFGRTLTAYASLREEKSTRMLDEMRCGMENQGIF